MSDFIVKSGTLNIIDNYLDSFMDKDEEKKNAKVEDDKVADDFYDAGEDEIYLNAKKAGSEEKNLADDFEFEALDLDDDQNEVNNNVINEKDKIENTKNNLKNIKVTMPHSTWGHWFGRGIQKTVNYFNSDISSSKTLTSTEEKINALRNKECQHPLPELKDKNAKPISMTTEQMGQATGLGKGTRVSSFDKTGKLDYKKVLFGKEGIPLLSDIKQDPNLQDCWFLSSISAVLTTLGPTSITRLFSKSENPNNVIVRLGEHTYDVPLGRIKKNGLFYGAYEFGSKSANWVVALENAMMMHRACHNSTARKVEMSMQSPTDGLEALLGYKFNSIGALMSLSYDSDEEALADIHRYFDAGFPVILGHDLANPGIDKEKDSHLEIVKKYAKVSLNTADVIRVTGIAAGHAVTVININDEEKKVEVLDPYGQVKKIPFNYLKAFRGNTVSMY